MEGSPPASQLTLLPLPLQCVAYFLRRRGGGAAAPSSPKRLLLLGMAGYLSETDFVMVEEGFSTRDLLEELTLGASQATAVRDGELGWVSYSPCRPFLEGLLGSSSSFIFGIQSLLLPEMGSFDPHFLVFAPNFVLPACPALMNSTTTIYPAL